MVLLTGKSCTRAIYRCYLCVRKPVAVHVDTTYMVNTRSFFLLHLLSISKFYRRMKLARDDPEKNVAIPFRHVFGISLITYILPLDPVFENEDDVFKYRLGDDKFQSTM